MNLRSSIFVLRQGQSEDTSVHEIPLLLWAKLYFLPSSSKHHVTLKNLDTRYPHFHQSNRLRRCQRSAKDMVLVLVGHCLVHRKPHKTGRMSSSSDLTFDLCSAGADFSTADGIKDVLRCVSAGTQQVGAP